MKTHVYRLLPLLSFCLLQACGPSGAPTNPNNQIAPSAAVPTPAPSASISAMPSNKPSMMPSMAPSVAPTMSPTVMPTMGPSMSPSVMPSMEPSMSPVPTATPTPMPTPTATPRSSSGGGGGGGGGSNPVTYSQMERLGRPAINEGLIITNSLLNTWNKVAPSVDLTSAAAPIATEATAVLAALGNDQATINALFTALLPDVMRIDTTRTSGYVGSAPGMLDNVTAQLRPIGGRMITDDVVDITLSLIVPGGAPAASPLPGFESDGVSYAGPNAGGTGHKPVLADFPYLAAPN